MNLPLFKFTFPHFKSVDTWILFTALQPYIGFAFLPSDTQPICLLLCLYKILFTKTNKISSRLLNFVFYSSIILAFAGFLSAFFYDPNTLELVRRIFPLAAFPIYIYTFHSIFQSQFSKKYIVSSIQLTVWFWAFGFILNLVSGNLITSLFVNRAVFDGFSARGYTSFYPEQSRIPEQMLFSFLILRISNINFSRLDLFLFLSSLLARSGQFIVSIFTLLPYSLIKLLQVNPFGLTFFQINKRFILFGIISLITFSVSLAFWLPSRGGLAITKIFDIGILYLQSDPGILIKLSGFFLTLAVILKPHLFTANIWNPWDLLNTEPLIDSSYRDVCQLFTGFSDCPNSYSLYTAFGSYIVIFGLIGVIVIFAWLLFLSVTFFVNARKSSYGTAEILSILFSCFILFFLKIPLANPSIALLLTSLFLAGDDGKA